MNRPIRRHLSLDTSRYHQVLSTINASPRKLERSHRNIRIITRQRPATNTPSQARPPSKRIISHPSLSHFSRPILNSTNRQRNTMITRSHRVPLVTYHLNHQTNRNPSNISNRYISRTHRHRKTHHNRPMIDSQIRLLTTRIVASQTRINLLNTRPIRATPLLRTRRRLHHSRHERPTRASLTTSTSQ